MEKVLLNFLLYLNDKGLINNHDFDYEKVARNFANKDEKMKVKATTIGKRSEKDIFKAMEAEKKPNKRF